MKGCDIFCSCGLETGSFAALNMAGAEGESGEGGKTLSLSLPAGCSAAMRYTSLQLTHVLWRSVSHTLDSSVDWPWLIAAGLLHWKKKPVTHVFIWGEIDEDVSTLTFVIKMSTCGAESPLMLPKCVTLDDAFVWILYSIVSARPVHVRPVAASCGGRCCLDPQQGLRWCLIRWPSVTCEDTPVKVTAPLQQIIRLGLLLRCLPDLWYDICIQFACVFGGPALQRCEDLVEGTSRDRKSVV